MNKLIFLFALLTPTLCLAELEVTITFPDGEKKIYNPSRTEKVTFGPFQCSITATENKEVKAETATFTCGQKPGSTKFYITFSTTCMSQENPLNTSYNLASKSQHIFNEPSKAKDLYELVAGCK